MLFVLFYVFVLQHLNFFIVTQYFAFFCEGSADIILKHLSHGLYFYFFFVTICVVIVCMLQIIRRAYTFTWCYFVLVPIYLFAVSHGASISMYQYYSCFLIINVNLDL